MDNNDGNHSNKDITAPMSKYWQLTNDLDLFIDRKGNNATLMLIDKNNPIIAKPIGEYQGSLKKDKGLILEKIIEVSPYQYGKDFLEKALDRVLSDYVIKTNASDFTGSSVEEIFPEVDSTNNIPVPKEDFVPPISFEGLPDFNFLKQYVDYMATISDTYPEFSFQNGIAMLSTLVRRRLYFKLVGDYHYTNLITLSLGQSGYARKSGPMKKAMYFLKKSIGETFLPKEATPEALVETMADTIEITQRTKAGDKTVAQNLNTKGIRMALRPLWKDEAGQWYAQAKKNQMTSIKELICHFYDCPESYDKTLVGKKIFIGPIYFGMNFATTFTSFMDNVATSDEGTGFLARHNIVFPEYDKPRKDIDEDSETVAETEKSFVDILKLLDCILSGPFSLRVNTSDECRKVLNEWAAERELYFKKERNDTMGSFFARFQINVLKVGLLIELGNLPFYLSQIKNVDNSGKIIIKVNEIIRKTDSSHMQYSIDNISNILNNNNNNIDIYDYYISRIGISLNSLLYAIKIYDSVYLAYTNKIFANKRETQFPNYISNIYNIIKHKKKISRSALMRNVTRTPEELNRAIEALKACDAVREYKVKGNTKSSSVYVFNPEPLEKFNFKPIQSIATTDDELVIELTKKLGAKQKQPPYHTPPPAPLNLKDLTINANDDIMDLFAPPPDDDKSIIHTERW